MAKKRLAHRRSHPTIEYCIRQLNAGRRSVREIAAATGISERWLHAFKRGDVRAQNPSFFNVIDLRDYLLRAEAEDIYRARSIENCTLNARLADEPEIEGSNDDGSTAVQTGRNEATTAEGS